MGARITLLAAAAVAAVGCSTGALPGAPHGGVSGRGSNCADVLASAMSSRQPVRGSWNCLTPALQEQFKSAGMEGDQALAAVAAKEPVYTREKFLGRLDDGAYVYGLAGQAGSSVLLVWLDGGGKVVDVRSGGRASGR